MDISSFSPAVAALAGMSALAMLLRATVQAVFVLSPPAPDAGAVIPFANGRRGCLPDSTPTDHYDLERTKSAAECEDDGRFDFAATLDPLEETLATPDSDDSDHPEPTAYRWWGINE
jgi:hypothetical protein